MGQAVGQFALDDEEKDGEDKARPAKNGLELQKDSEAAASKECPELDSEDKAKTNLNKVRVGSV